MDCGYDNFNYCASKIGQAYWIWHAPSPQEVHSLTDMYLRYNNKWNIQDAMSLNSAG